MSPDGHAASHRNDQPGTLLHGDAAGDHVPHSASGLRAMDRTANLRSRPGLPGGGTRRLRLPPRLHAAAARILHLSPRVVSADCGAADFVYDVLPAGGATA